VKPAAGGGATQKTASQDLAKGLMGGARRAMAAVRHVCDDLEGLVLGNEIVQQRTIGVGVLPAERAIEYGVSGPNLRGSGVPFDLRKVEDYLPYHRFDFDVITMPNGDNYDRCRVRLEEIRQSARIIEQALDSLPAGPLQAKVPRVIKVPKGECYVRAENPKGEMGYHIISGGGRRPYRVKIRSASFCNLAILPWLLEGALIPDIIAILGSLDFVLGDVDR
jgi:NADH-quinone oxidoreductase subunit D